MVLVVFQERLVFLVIPVKLDLAVILALAVIRASVDLAVILE